MATELIDRELNPLKCLFEFSLSFGPSNRVQELEDGPARARGSLQGKKPVKISRDPCESKEASVEAAELVFDVPDASIEFSGGGSPRR